MATTRAENWPTTSTWRPVTDHLSMASLGFLIFQIITTAHKSHLENLVERINFFFLKVFLTSVDAATLYSSPSPVFLVNHSLIFLKGLLQHLSCLVCLYSQLSTGNV